MPRVRGSPGTKRWHWRGTCGTPWRSPPRESGGRRCRAIFPRVPTDPNDGVRRVERVAGDVIGWVWRRVERTGRVLHGTRRARRFARFGADSVIGFPPAALHGVERIQIGARTTIGPHATLSAGMLVPLDHGRDPLLTIGDRCVFGKGVSIVAHEHIEIGDDTAAGHYVYITDQNHGYSDIDVPIGRQMWKNAPVRIGPACWLGHGSIILPGASIGRHVVVAAGSVVTGEIPDYSVVVGAPARIVRRYLPDRGWVPTDPDGKPRD
ncbi:MAG: acyltransferase [Nitriliruptorales bacterium]|nr:acyltransferase [Nitriliruptorales bacterium]